MRVAAQAIGDRRRAVMSPERIGTQLQEMVIVVKGLLGSKPGAIQGKMLRDVPGWPAAVVASATVVRTLSENSGSHSAITPSKYLLTERSLVGESIGSRLRAELVHE